jgi:hypothetical protein
MNFSSETKYNYTFTLLKYLNPPISQLLNIFKHICLSELCLGGCGAQGEAVYKGPSLILK